MRVIIAGSRTIDCDWLVAEAVEKSGFKPTEIVSGGASGVDNSGAAYGKFLGIPVREFKADWRKHGKAAGPIRNREMAAYADALILIWNGQSRGSANMKCEAERVGMKIFEVRI